MSFLRVLRTQNTTFRGDPPGRAHPTFPRGLTSEEAREIRPGARGMGELFRRGRLRGYAGAGEGAAGARVARIRNRPRFPPTRYGGPRMRREGPYAHRLLLAENRPWIAALP